MKHILKLGGLGLSAALIGLAPEIAQAEPTQVTDIQVVSTDSGLQLQMETANGDRPQIFLVKRGSDLIADLINTQLSLPQGGSYSQDNPAQGIASVSVTALDANSTRVVVSGYGVAPEGRAIDDAASGGIILSYAAGEGAALGSAIAPPGISSTPIAQAQGRQPFRNPSPDVLIPNPDIQIDGVPIDGIGPINPVPQFQPRAVAPPVGDIAISSTDVSSFTLNLRTAERVPRLVLREAPVEDVLALLARAAGLNLAYVADAPEGTGAGDAPARRTISLDVENEAVQEVFNNVLRLSGLQANLMGNTVVVGNELPDEARNIITRTIRLNQTSVLVARDFLLSHGAEAALLTTQIQSQTLREGQPGELSAVTATTTTTRTRLEPLGLDRKDEPYTGYAALPLRGLLVSIAPRSIGVSEVANEISITGDPRKVEVASQLLTQLETRRRQAAINVKIVDVSLSNQDTYNSSFAFQAGDTFVNSDGGAGLINFGGVQPPSREQIDISPTTPPISRIPGTLVDSPNGVFFDPDTGAAFPSFGSQGNTEIIQPGVNSIGTDGTLTFSLPTLFEYPSRFLAQLEAQVVSGNAKILTDPVLVVQEGQTSTISLTSQVVSRVNVSFTDTDAGTRETRDIELVDVGLTLPISLKRIDDNGFVTLEAAPTISSPVDTVDLGNNQSATLVQRRAVNSGDIRLRDGQTLILSGIIQDTDRTTVRKVPILGDIPLLGALFRSTNRTNERQEVIILLTPNILDDSDNNTFGYGYTPSREARDFLQQQSNF